MYSKYLKEYLEGKDSIDGKTAKALYDGEKLYSTELSGKLSSFFYTDGKLKNTRGLTFDYSNEKVTANLIGIKDKKIEVLNSEVIFEMFPTLDKFTITLFGIKQDNKVKFFLEVNGEATLLANGKYLSIRKLDILDDKLSLGDEITFEGSDFNETETNSYKEKVQELGLVVDDVKESIFSQNSKAKKIFEIKRRHLDDFKNDSNVKNGEIIEYGETEFRDCYIRKYFLNLENIKSDETKDESTRVEKGNVFSDDYLGHYTWNNGKDNITFELNNDGNDYGYILLYYPNSSIHESEELWGKWDSNSSKFVLESESSSLAEYEVSNIKYLENNISFKITLTKLNDEQNKDYVINNGEYVLKKENN